MAVWLFAKVLWKHWWALMGSAFFTAIAFYAAWWQKSEHWVVAASTLGALALFLVASFLAWMEEHDGRERAEEASSWKALGEKFKGLDDGGAVIARWNQDSATKKYTWQIMGGSIVLTNLCIEMCKDSGRKLLGSRFFLKEFPDIAVVEDDGERWLMAVRNILQMGKVRGQTTSVCNGAATDSEWGEISHLTGASQVMCYRAFNDLAR